MESKRHAFLTTFQRYVPAAFAEYLTDCVLEANVRFRIVKSRKSKLGDFRLPQGHETPVITINGDLNPYSFLVTALHELAHLDAFRQFGPRIQAHGDEWKQAFRQRLLPVLESGHLPKDLEAALWKSFTNTKASSCTDLQLHRSLKRYDTQQGLVLEQLPHLSHFSLNGKTFEKGLLRRSRYLCTELQTGKSYLVHALAHVQVKNHE
ncbi:MAG: hypothetical protein RLZZ301_1503 [Bacteroidota bacterium]